MSLVYDAIQNGGKIVPLLMPSIENDFPTYLNPSVFVDGDTIYCCIRNTNYIFTQANFEIIYIINDNDKLFSRSWLCELDNNLDIINYKLIDTSNFDISPKHIFVGLEDCRIVKWEDKFYLTGVRRDVVSDGEGRIELSEISDYKEISRVRINVPNYSYCEKNWMPILDMPYHFIKWTSPTEVVKVVDNNIDIVFLSDSPFKNYRGSSQVIRIGNYRIAIIHITNVCINKINSAFGQYNHKFIVWDLNWNIVCESDEFNFMDGKVEFCCGMAVYGNDILITYAFQDSATYILRMPINYLFKYLGLK